MNDIFESIVRPMAEKLLERADLPHDKIKAENRKNVFLNELKSLNYEYEINRKIVVKDNNGFTLSDEHGWDYSITEIVQNTFNKYFDISTMPINETEYFARLKDKNITPTERIRITEYWQKKTGLK